MLEFYTDNREEFLTHCHKRSNVETTFHMTKSKFGQRLRSKTLTAQINEALCKILCHNLCVVIASQHELGIETNFTNELAAYRFESIFGVSSAVECSVTLAGSNGGSLRSLPVGVVSSG